MIDLRKQDNEAIAAIAATIFPKGTKIWAYGSRVKGTNHSTSDLDLAVHFPQEQDETDSAAQLSGFIEALRDSTIPIIVQVMAWHNMPESFHSNILKAYHVFWISPEG